MLLGTGFGEVLRLRDKWSKKAILEGYVFLLRHVSIYLEDV